MKRIIWYIGIGLLLCSCGSSKHYGAFQYDNGNDYVSEGLYRILDMPMRTVRRLLSLDLLSDILLRVARRKLRIPESEKRFPAPMGNIGTGKVRSGIILTNPGIVFNKKRPL